MRRLAAVVVAFLLAAPAHAEEPARDWHLGLNLRPELAVHPVRVGGGLRAGTVDALLVLDPFFWTDGVIDTDLVAEWWLLHGFALFGGWRPTAIDLGDGHQIQHRMLLGAGAALPPLPGEFRAHVGLELALLLYKHGGGLPSDGLSFDRSAADHISVGAFLQVEYASPF